MTDAVLQPAGQARLDALSQGGFTTDEVNEYRNRVSGTMSAAGFRQDEINDYWGVKTPDMSGVQAIAADAPKKSGSLTPDNPDIRHEMITSYENGEAKNPNEFMQSAFRSIVPVIAGGISRASHPIESAENAVGEMTKGIGAMAEFGVAHAVAPFLPQQQVQDLMEQGILSKDHTFVDTDNEQLFTREFEQYAQPGESIVNNADRATVLGRMMQDSNNPIAQKMGIQSKYGYGATTSEESIAQKVLRGGAQGINDTLGAAMSIAYAVPGGIMSPVFNEVVRENIANLSPSQQEEAQNVISLTMNLMGLAGMGAIGSEISAIRTARRLGPQFKPDTGPWMAAPAAQAFPDAAININGKNSEAEISQVLRNIYVEQGKHPAQVLADAKADPTIAQDMAAGKVPKVYQPAEPIVPFKSNPVASVASQAKSLVENSVPLTADRAVAQEAARGPDMVQYQAEGATKAELFGKAEELKPEYTGWVKDITDGVKGADPYAEGKGGESGVRVKNEEGRIDEKIADKGGNAGAVSDYLGGAIEVANPEALRQVLENIKASGKKVIEVEDMLTADHKEKDDGYRAIHMQIELKPGFSAELQIIPKSIAKIKETMHPEYKKLRDAQGNETPASEAARQKMVAAYQKAFDKFIGKKAARPTPLPKKYPSIPKEIKNPVLRFIKARGGVERGSVLDAEIKEGGNISPRFYAKKGQGLKDVDNFPLSEWQKELDAGKDDGNGYVDRQYVLDAIRAEQVGNPITRDMQKIIDEHGHDVDYAAHVAETESQHEFDRINGEIADYQANELQKAEEAYQERLAISGEKEESIQTRTEEDIENELRQENNATKLRAGEAATERPAGVTETEAGSQQRSEQRGAAIEPAGRQAEIPGTRGNGEQLAAAHAGRRIRPTVAQKAPDEGLFDTGARDQQDIFMSHPERGAIDLSGKPESVRTDAENKILEKISVGPRDQPRVRLSWNNFYKAAVDRLDPIYRIQEEWRKGNQGAALQDTYKLLRNAAGSFGRARQFIENATFKFDTYENDGKSLKDILAPASDDMQGLRAYAIARTAIEDADKGLETGINIDAAKQVISDGAKKYEPIFKDLNGYNDRLLQYLVDSGVLTKDAAEAMRGARKAYMPLNRVMDEENVGLRAASGKIRNPIMKRRGSERDIIDPIESMVANTYKFIAVAEKNAAAKSFFDWASKQPNAEELFSKQPPVIKPTKISEEEMKTFLTKEGITDMPEGMMTVFRAMKTPLAADEFGFFDKGKWTVLKVDPELADAFNLTPRSMHPFLGTMLGKAMAIPAKGLRYGLIVPEFLLRHLERNSLSSFVVGEKAQYPFEQLFTGLFSYIKKDQWYQDFLKSGGYRSAVSGLSRSDIGDQMKRLTGEYPAADMMQKVWNLARSPGDIMHAIQQSLETANNLGSFKNALRGLNVDKNNIVDAGFYSRNVTPDPSRIGSMTSTWNALTALANTEIQHTAQLFDALKHRPIPTLAKGFAAITLPTLINWYANHNDPSYKNAPAWEKDAFWIIPTGGFTLRIPKPFLMGFLFGTVPEHLLDLMAGDDPHLHGVGSMVKDMFEQATPNVIPNAVMPILEQITNNSMFRAMPLVPQHLMDGLPEYRYSPYTSELTKAIGRMIGKVPYVGMTSSASPIVIDNYLRQWTGAYGTYVKELMDYTLRKTGALPDPLLPAKTLADIPFVRAFVMRYPDAQAQPIMDFQESYRNMTMVTTSYKNLIKEGNYPEAVKLMNNDPTAFFKLDGINKALNEHNQLVHQLYKAPDIKPDEKRQLIEGLYYHMIQIANEGNKIIENINYPQKKAAGQ